MSFITGYPIHKYTCTIRLATDLVLPTAKEIAQRQNQKLIGEKLQIL